MTPGFVVVIKQLTTLFPSLFSSKTIVNLSHKEKRDPFPFSQITPPSHLLYGTPEKPCNTTIPQRLKDRIGFSDGLHSRDDFVRAWPELLQSLYKEEHEQDQLSPWVGSRLLTLHHGAVWAHRLKFLRGYTSDSTQNTLQFTEHTLETRVWGTGLNVVLKKALKQPYTITCIPASSAPFATHLWAYPLHSTSHHSHELLFLSSPSLSSTPLKKSASSLWASVSLILCHQVAQQVTVRYMLWKVRAPHSPWCCPGNYALSPLYV